VPRLPKFRKRPVAYADAELKKFFAVCDDWERAFFSLVLATGLRRGELQTLHWPDLDLAHRRVHVRAKPRKLEQMRETYRQRSTTDSNAD